MPAGDGAGMSRHDEKIIPTLDDVIRPGDLNSVSIRERRNTPDDTEEENISLFTDTSDELDDAFDDEFEKIYAEADSLLQVEAPDETSAELIDDIDDDADDDEVELQLRDDPATPEVSDDFDLEIDDNAESEHDELADMIVAEKFPEDASVFISHDDDDDSMLLPQAEADQEFDVASESNDTRTDDVKTPVITTDENTTAPAVSEPPAAVGAEIDVKQLVDDITTKLMPEIEWKVRVRLREILDELFPGK